ncbi:MAG: mechanosensitive ion channel family protein [Oscillospiraceae bacterium]
MKSLNSHKLSSAILHLLAMTAALVFLLNPKFIPFLSDSTRNALSKSLAANFGRAAKDTDEFALLSVPTLVNVLAVILLVSLISKLLRLILSKMNFKRNRSRTVVELISSVIRYTAGLTILVWCLSLVGVNLGGIFASLGILSLIVGFGAQSLIADIITGVFIIFEGQYNIGDVIVLDNFRGTVRKIGVRTTTLEDAGGNLKIINNSDIRNMQNLSRNLSVALCDISVSYDDDFAETEKKILEFLPDITAAHPELFVGNVEYLGIEQFGDSAITLRFVAHVREENIFAATRALRREVRLGFTRHSIEIPYNRLVIQCDSRNDFSEKL